MRFCRVDGNHAEVVKAFRKFGCSVLNISVLKNCGDIVVAKNYKTVIIEVKDGSKPPSKRRLTRGESEFSAGWQGLYFVVKDLSDVLDIVRALEK